MNEHFWAGINRCLFVGFLRLMFVDINNVRKQKKGCYGFKGQIKILDGGAFGNNFMHSFTIFKII